MYIETFYQSENYSTYTYKFVLQTVVDFQIVHVPSQEHPILFNVAFNRYRILSEKGKQLAQTSLEGWAWEEEAVVVVVEVETPLS